MTRKYIGLILPGKRLRPEDRLALDNPDDACDSHLYILGAKEDGATGLIELRCSIGHLDKLGYERTIYVGREDTFMVWRFVEQYEGRKEKVLAALEELSEAVKKLGVDGGS